MKQIFYIHPLFFVIFINIPLFAIRSNAKQIKSETTPSRRLFEYGFQPWSNRSLQSNSEFKLMLQNYQKLTRKLGERTKRHVNQLRCGNKDKSIIDSNLAALSKPYKWSRSSLTYSLRGYPTQISEEKTKAIIGEAFNTWLRYAPLKIESVCSTCKADFVIEFQRHQHSDAYPFDGIGGVLAHAFSPEDGRIHFDKDETWTESFDYTSTNLYLVAVHVIGHALGLEHSYNRKSMIYPVYELMPKTNILPESDRVAIQNLYGTKQTSSGTTARSTTTTWKRFYTTTKNSITVPSGRSNPRCRIFLDAAFKHPDGTLHTFDTGVLWRYLLDENRWENQASSFRSTYPNLPDRLGGVAYNNQTKELIFFTNRDVYYYDIDHQNIAKYRRKEGLPRNLQNSIVGAINYRNGIYIITKKRIRLFQSDSGRRVPEGEDLSEEFPGFEGTVKTAFSYGDLHHFFTADRRVYVWNERLNTWQTPGKPMETNWFACSGGGNIRKDVQTEEPAQRPNHRDPHRRRHQHDHHE